MEVEGCDGRGGSSSWGAGVAAEDVGEVMVRDSESEGEEKRVTDEHNECVMYHHHHHHYHHLVRGQRMTRKGGLISAGEKNNSVTFMGFVPGIGK